MVTLVPLAPVCRRARSVSLLSTMPVPLVIASKVLLAAFQRTFESAPVLMVRFEGLQPVVAATVVRAENGDDKAKRLEPPEIPAARTSTKYSRPQ